MSSVLTARWTRTAVLSLALIALLVPAFRISMTNLVAVHDVWHRFAVGDWLISYAGGFVRRGLSGEFLFAVSRLTGFSLSQTLFSLQLVLLATFFVCGGLLVLRQRRVWPFLLLIVAPFVFMFQVHDPAGGFRKELLHIALLALLSLAAVCLDTERFRIAVRTVLLVYPLAILSHEMLAIYQPYLVAVALCRLGAGKRTVIEIALLLVPSVIAFGATLVFSGTEHHVAAICAALGENVLWQCSGNSAVGWLATSIDEARLAVRERIALANYIPTYLYGAGLCAVGFVPAAGRLRLLWRHQLPVLCILTSVLGSILLFVFALDWGRFIYLHGVSLFLLLLSLEAVEPPPEGEPTGRIARLLRRWRYVFAAAYAVMAWAYATDWRLVHYY